MRQLILLLSTLILFGTASGQSGWDLVKTGDHRSAKHRFQEQLQVSPTDEASIIGLIMMAELEQDQFSYQKHVEALLTHHLNDRYYRLFGHVYSPAPQAVIDQPALSPELKVQAHFDLGDSLQKKREFGKAEAAYRSVLGDYEWSLIGPFSNETGSGHTRAFAVEQDLYLPDKTYADDNGMEFKWHLRKIRNHSGQVVFDEHLPNNYAGTVYYANTFVEVASKQIVQLRVARNTAIKIWVDDRLVYDSPDKRSFNWDQDIVELDLEAGWHRILVKSSSTRIRFRRPLLNFYDTETYSSLGLVFNPALDEQVGDGSELLTLLDNLGSRFAIRITDQQGSFIPERRSQFEAPFYNTNISVRKKSFYPTDDWKVGRITQGIDLMNYYLLTKSYFKHSYLNEGEAFLEKITESVQGIPLVTYLKAKFYYANNKPELATKILKDLSWDRAPVFQTEAQKLESYKADFEGSSYLTLLNKLNQVCPSNWRVVKGYIDFYHQLGDKGQLKKYTQELIEAFPAFKPYVEPYLESLELTEKGKSLQKFVSVEEAEEALNNMEVRLMQSDYKKAIQYYLQIDDPEQAIFYADELIRYFDYRTDLYNQKAQICLRYNKLDAALDALQASLKIAPYDASTMEAIGDVYARKKDKQTALLWYDKAKRYRNPYTYRSVAELNRKIDQIRAKGDYSALLNRESLKDVLKDKRWVDRYQYEDAVVLRYNKDVIVKSMMEAEVRQFILIKVLNRIGVGKWKEADFSFFGALSAFDIIKANGKKVPFQEEDGNLLTEELEVGDLIHIEGSFTWPLNRDLKNELAMVNYVGFDAPTYQTNFNLILPEGEFVQFQTRYIEDSYQKETADGYDSYRWRLIDLPKVEHEAALPDESDVYPCILFSTMEDWSKVVQWFEDKTYRTTEPTRQTRDLLDKIFDGPVTEEDKVRLIHEYITRNYYYTAGAFAENRHMPKLADQTIAARSGDSKDLSALAISLLEEAGIDAYFVLVRTQPSNRSVLLPGKFFDHVIVGCDVNGSSKFLDLTSDYYPSDVVSEFTANAWALKVKAGEKEIFRLPEDYLDVDKNLLQIDVRTTLKREGPMQVLVTSEAKGLVAGYFREIFNVASHAEQQQFILENFGYGVFDDIAVLGMDLGDLEAISKPLTSELRFSVNAFVNDLSGQLVCRLPFMRTVLPSPVIFAETRLHPLSLERMLQIDPVEQRVALTIPKDMQLANVPDNFELDSPFGTYRLSFERSGPELVITKYQVFKQREISPSQFQEFKAFYLAILKADGQKLSFISS